MESKEMNLKSQTQPNNSFNRSANSGAFIRETCVFNMVRRARLDTVLRVKRFVLLLSTLDRMACPSSTHHRRDE